MPDERARKIAEEALSRLASALDNGKSEALKNYLSAMSRFHRYSWGNVLLIGAQKPDATHVAGYHTWHDLGRFVKKGEKGIMIFAPMLVKQNDPSQATDQNKKNEVFRLTGFRTAYVFDVEQTEGRPLPQFAVTTGDPKHSMEKLKTLVAKEGIALEYDKSIAPALGVSSGGRIRLVPGLSAAEEFSVLAHELAHEMLHHRKETAPPSKLVRETQAEAVAFVVCRGVGLETNTAAADYIALYNGDKKTLAESLSVIQETSARILDNLLSEQRPSQSQERVSEVMGPKTQSDYSPNRSESPNPEPGHPSTSTPDRIDSVSLDR